MTPDHYIRTYTHGRSCRDIRSLSDFLLAVASGEDIFRGRQAITYETMTSTGDYEALKALGWSAGSDYGSYGSEPMTIWNPNEHVEKYFPEEVQDRVLHFLQEGRITPYEAEKALREYPNYIGTLEDLVGDR